jgi:catechol 2,3-dioxygenase-like lactoylglutathione lyase family enzyme
MDLPINVDVPDLAAAIAFYTGAFGLTVTRLFGTDGAELDGWPVRLYLLQKLEGSAFGSGLPPRSRGRTSSAQQRLPLLTAPTPSKHTPRDASVSQSLGHWPGNAPKRPGPGGRHLNILALPAYPGRRL